MVEENILIRDKLQITNNLNEIYCDIHDSFVRQKLGKEFDYVSALEELSDIKCKLLHEIEECESISTEDNDAEKVIDALKDYQNLLNIRMELLLSILEKLHNKAENILGYKYSYFAYSKDRKNLNKLENQTDNIGRKLQISAVGFMRKYR